MELIESWDATKETKENTPLLNNTSCEPSTPVQVEKRKLRGRDLLKILAVSLYMVLLAFRFLSLLMYTIFCANCLLYRSSSGTDCQNFTTYPHPYRWKAAWSVLSVINLLVLLSLPLSISRYIRDLAPLGFLAILNELKGRPQFWTSVAQVICAIIYDVMITAENRNADDCTVAFFIAMKFLTVLMIYQLNFVFPPTTAGGHNISVVVAYNLTLLCFAMENLSKFFIESTEVVFKVYTFHLTEEQHPVKVINLMLMLIDTSLYAFFWHFLWNKLFCGDKDILTTFRANFENTLGIG